MLLIVIIVSLQLHSSIISEKPENKPINSFVDSETKIETNTNTNSKLMSESSYNETSPISIFSDITLEKISVDRISIKVVLKLMLM